MNHSYVSRTRKNNQAGQSVGGYVVVLLVFFLFVGIIFWAGSRALSWFAPKNSALDPSPGQTSLVSTKDELIVVDNPPAQDPGVTLDDIQLHSEQYMGQEVTVVGVTSTRAEPWGFTIVENESDSDEVLVVLLPSVKGINEVQKESFAPGTAVKVTGIVKRISNEEHEEFGFELNDLQRDPWINQNAIQALKVEKVQLQYVTLELQDV